MAVKYLLSRNHKEIYYKIIAWFICTLTCLLKTKDHLQSSEAAMLAYFS